MFTLCKWTVDQVDDASFYGFTSNISTRVSQFFRFVIISYTWKMISAKDDDASGG